MGEEVRKQDQQKEQEQWLLIARRFEGSLMFNKSLAPTNAILIGQPALSFDETNQLFNQEIRELIHELMAQMFQFKEEVLRDMYGEEAGNKTTREDSEGAT